MKVLITGSSGLIGSQAVKFFIEKGYDVIGIDNDMRSYFFGESASTFENAKSLVRDFEKFTLHPIDIRNYSDVEKIFIQHKFEIVIHTAAQPSHDWAAKEPLTDFTVNALGTMNLLELTRIYSPKATFIFTSTNKVYGDTPNRLNLIEQDSRYEYVMDCGGHGSVDEKMSIDHTTHSIFGASKVAADVMVQEYGKYFGMNTVVFRGGCLTGPQHAGTELHGFLSYLVKCIVNDKPYTIFGYKGKQVRDNIHSWDLVNMFWHYHQKPRPGEVYNAGGGRENSTSIIEAIETINSILHKKDGRSFWDKHTYSPDNRIGDHVWYISDLKKFRDHYPEWNITIGLKDTIEQMIDHELN
jgi:CDP-paratose 2-epimerase